MEKLKKLWPMFAIFGGIILLIIIMIMIAGSGNPYLKYEDSLISAAKKYYKDNEGLLPARVGSEVSIDASYLKDGEYLKNYKKECTKATVVAYRGEKDISYYADIDCGKKYSTNYLTKKLLTNVVTDEKTEGLYKIDDIKKKSNIVLGTDKYGYRLKDNPFLSGYIYRGSNPKNFLRINNKMYRIIQIDGDGDIVAMAEESRSTSFDSSYNKDYAEGKAGFNNKYHLSKVNNVIHKYIDTNFPKKKKFTKYLVYKHICVGERKPSSTYNDGYEECSEVTEKAYKGGVISTHQFLLASLSTDCSTTHDRACANYNYLQNKTQWTSIKEPGTSYGLYNIGYSGLRTQLASEYDEVYPLVFLSKRAIYSAGDGTENNPYEIK